MLKRFFPLTLRRRAGGTIKKRPIALSLAALAGLLLFQKCDSYRAEYHDFADVFVRHEAGALEVSMVGEWSELPNGDNVLGSPYIMFVRYVDTEGMQQVEVRALTLREQVTGVEVPLARAAPEPFTPIPPPGRFGFGPTGQDPMAVPPNQYVAFGFPYLRLKYRPYEVSGVLVLRRPDGMSREVSFSGVLVPKPRVEKRSSLGDALSSV